MTEPISFDKIKSKIQKRITDKLFIQDNIGSAHGAAEYILALTEELAQMAFDARLDLLADLLRKAQIEAEFAAARTREASHQ